MHLQMIGSPVRPSKAAGRWRRHGAASADDRCCAAASLIRLVYEAAGDEWSCFTPHPCPEPSSTTSYVFLRRSGVPSPSPSCVSTASKAIQRGRRSILSSCIRLTCQSISAANEPQATIRNHLLREKTTRRAAVPPCHHPTTVSLKPKMVRPADPIRYTSADRAQTLPSSWETSIFRLPCSKPTPAGLLASDHCDATAWPLVCKKQRLPRLGLSKLNSMAFGLAVYAS